MRATADKEYTPSTLHDRYQIDLGEAKRLINSFGSNRLELDRLLGSRTGHRIRPAKRTRLRPEVAGAVHWKIDIIGPRRDSLISHHFTAWLVRRR